MAVNEDNTTPGGSTQERRAVDRRIVKVELDVEILKEEQREFREQLKAMFMTHHKDMSDIAIRHSEQTLKTNQDIAEVHKILAAQAERSNIEYGMMNTSLKETNEAFHALTSTFDKWGQRAVGAIIALGVIYFIMSGTLPDFLISLVE